MVGILPATAGPPPARAADLRLGVAVETDTIDPHFHFFGGALSLTSQIFEPLVAAAADGRLVPCLATTWRPVGDAAWQFELRPGITFSDGTPLTADDVAFTLSRAQDVPKSPAGFGPSLRAVQRVESPGPGTVLIHTRGPAPLLPAYLANIGIVSRKHGSGASTEDYNSGRAAIGTGPYRFVSWSRGDQVVLARNPTYWGAPPEWETARIRAIANPTARVAALLANDVDLIDAVPIESTGAIRTNGGFKLAQAVSNNVIALVPDVAQRTPPFAAAMDGTPLQANPLADPRVRQALVLSINREQLKDRVMAGEAEVAGQLMAPGRFGHDPAVTVPTPDPAAARRLLAEAGHPNGFRLTMHCQSDRFANGSSICQAVAQMLTRAGIRAEPAPVPHAMFIGRANKHEYSLFTAFMLVETGEPSATMLTTLATGGNFNRGQYANAAFDALVDRAQKQIDPAAREATLNQATGMLARDVAYIPLLRPLNIEAMRSGLAHQPRGDGVVAAAAVQSAP